MSSERLQRWALTAEIIGGVAIVVSLIFVGYEVRQSTKEAALNRSAIETATYQGLMENIAALNEPAIRDPGFADIWGKLRNKEALTIQEEIRMSAYAGVTFRHGDMAFFQYQKGVIDEDRLKSALKIVINRINNYPYFREDWDRVKYERFDNDYADYVDAQLLEQRPNPSGAPLWTK